MDSQFNSMATSITDGQVSVPGASSSFPSLSDQTESKSDINVFSNVQLPDAQAPRLVGAQSAAAPRASPDASAQSSASGGAQAANQQQQQLQQPPKDSPDAKAAANRKGSPPARTVAANKPGKADGKKAPKAGAGGAGRNRRDAVILLRAALSQFLQCDASTHHAKYLGTEWKNVNRNWSNYIADLDCKIEVEDDTAVLAEYESIKKQAISVKLFLNKWSSAGPNSPATVRVYESQVAYCSKAPVAPNPFPAYVIRLMHSQLCQDAWPAKNFWSKWRT